MTVHVTKCQKKMINTMTSLTLQLPFPKHGLSEPPVQGTHLGPYVFLGQHTEMKKTE